MKRIKAIIAVCGLFTVVFVGSSIGFRLSTQSVFEDIILIPNTSKNLTTTLSTTTRFNESYSFSPNYEQGNVEYISISAYGEDSDAIIQGLVDGEYQELVTCSATWICQYEHDEDIYDSYQIITDDHGEVNIVQGYINKN